MIKRFILMFLVVAVVVAGLGLYKYRQVKAGMAMFATMGPPPSAVTTTVVKAQTWQPTLNAVGSLKAVNGVTVSTDLAGIVSSIAFESGATVKKGDLLVKLDTKQEDAQLQSADAKEKMAKLNLDRQVDLLGKKVAAQSEFDSATLDERQAQAALEESRAMIARKTIVAPFDGVLGIRQVDLGQYVNVGAPIVPLQSLDPIYADFSLPQQNLEQLVVGKKVLITADGVGGEMFEGEIAAIDSRVDETTRNIMVRAIAHNRDNRLRSGMFVNIEVLLPKKSGVLAVPASAVSYAPYGDSVFIVKSKEGADGKPAKEAQQQFVKLGPARGDQVAVLSGVKEGEEVVTSGVFKLRSGAEVQTSPIQVNNSVQPGNDPNPTPPNS